MSRRLDLHRELVDILGSDNVYFQPPESVKMNYPCIIYELDDLDVKFASNKLYLKKRRYKITVLDKNPDNDIPERLLKMSLCSFDRSYTTNNLNHYVFTLYF